MRVLFFILIAVGFSACAQKKTEVLRISYYKPYCRGARPTPEMERQAATPLPYAHRRLLIVTAHRVDSAITDSAGILKIRLAQGRTEIYEPWRYMKRAPDNSPVSRFNDSCLRAEWKKPLKTLVLTKKKVTVTSHYQLTEPCAWRLPCLSDESRPPMPE